jgi:hypothetical protein
MSGVVQNEPEREQNRHFCAISGDLGDTQAPKSDPVVWEKLVTLMNKSTTINQMVTTLVRNRCGHEDRPDEFGFHPGSTGSGTSPAIPEHLFSKVRGARLPIDRGRINCITRR